MVGIVAKSDVAEFDVAPHLRQLNRMLGIRWFGLLVQQSEDSFRTGHGGLQDIEFLGEVPDWLKSTIRVLHGRNQCTKGEGRSPARDYAVSPNPQEKRRRECAEKHNNGHEDRIGKHG